MPLGRTLVHLSRLGIVMLAGFIAAGCVIEDPPAIKEIAKARKAIDDARKAGKDKDCPDKFADLEKRYLQARGTFYACQDAKALQEAAAIIKDTDCPKPPNRPPVARLTGPERGQTGVPLAFDASGSSDPDGDALTYAWDFGDGSPMTKTTAPRATRSYTRPDNYTVRVTVDDGRGGTDSASTRVVASQVVDLKGAVLFDYDKAVLKPQGIQELSLIAQGMKARPDLRATIVGHTDSDGTDAYNMGLSKRRAEAVRNYLVSQGIAPARLATSWKGESEPLVPNTTPENKAQNRRVVITITPGG